MFQQDIIRAWKDEEFRNSLSEDQRSQLPENPAGIVEISDEYLETIVGGAHNSTGEGTGTGCCICVSGDGTGGNCCVP